jgi:uncharacterized protein (UPF0332 family)
VGGWKEGMGHPEGRGSSMMTDEKKNLLALHRLQQAKESVEEARYLLDGGKSLRSVANRIYYGMFYAVLALSHLLFLKT